MPFNRLDTSDPLVFEYLLDVLVDLVNKKRERRERIKCTSHAGQGEGNVRGMIRLIEKGLVVDEKVRMSP